MGEAKHRGTYDERKTGAAQRDAEARRQRALAEQAAWERRRQALEAQREAALAKLPPEARAAVEEQERKEGVRLMFASGRAKERLVSAASVAIAAMAKG